MLSSLLAGIVISMTASPKLALADATSTDLSSVYQVKAYIRRSLDSVNGEEQFSTQQSFKEIDNIVNRYKLRYRLQLLLSDTPASNKICATGRIDKINEDLACVFAKISFFFLSFYCIGILLCV
jgi:hypothetical protein